MSCNLFDAVEKFELVDVDGVVLTEPLEIREPSGFGQINIVLSRNLDDRGGANFEFGDSESTLGFDGYCGYAIILEIIDTNGSDSNILLNYYRKESGVFVKKYTGSLITSSISEEDDELKFRVKREDFGEKLRTRYDIDQPVDTAFDLDGNEILEINLEETGLHSKALDLKFDAINETGDPPVNLVDSYTAGVDPSRSYANEALLQLGASKVNINTIGDVLQPIDYGTRLFKPVTGPIEDYIRANFLYNFKVLKTGKITLDMFIKGTFDLYLEATSGNPQLTFYLIFEVVRPVGTEYLSTKLVPDQVFSGGLIIDETIDININQSFDLDLEEGWNIYIYGVLDFLNLSGGVFPVTVSSDYTFNLESLYYGFNNQSFAAPSTVKGLFIYDALNRLIQKAVGAKVRELDIYYTSVSPFIVGDEIKGLTSGANGLIFSSSSSGILYTIKIINIQGEFITGETIVNSLSLNPHLIRDIDSGKLLSSSILERKENGAVNDGVGALNLITNGFAIRGFLNEEWDVDVYYKKGDNVKYGKIDYTYINENVTAGNLPTDAAFWVIQKGRNIGTSIKKLVDFVKHRYGAGLAIIQEEGSGYGVETNEKVTRVLIEKQSHFFQDEEIIVLDGVANPITRTLNKDILFNTIELGYKLFSKENEQSSISGFNTDREYITPIKKDKKKLSLMCDVCTDGYEIERLRRLTQSETPNESDEKDEETFIIKHFRVDGSTEDYMINPLLYKTKGTTDYNDYRVLLIRTIGAAPNTLRIRGVMLPTLVVGDKLVIDGLGDPEYNITGIILDFQNNETVLTTSSGTSGSINVINKFFFKTSVGGVKTVFIPSRLEGIDSVLNSNDSYSEYNIDHVPTKILANNFGWFGGSLRTKAFDSLVRFTKGTNNTLFAARAVAPFQEITNVRIFENQDFELLSLRSWSPSMFDENEYEIEANFSYEDLEKIRLAMTGEAVSGNFGYITFIDNQGVTKQGYPMTIKYKAFDNSCKLTLWGKS